MRLEERHMPPILAAGVLIGVLCGAWTLVMGITGWYKDPVMLNAFFLVIALEIGGLIWGLRKTAAEGRTYGGQIVAGTMMTVIAGVIIMVFSLLFTMVLFPNYFTELQDAYRQILRQQGKSDAEIAEAVRRSMAGATPMGQAVQGFVGTFLTGILASAVIAIFARARRVPSAPPG
jgi:hypothetical protein